MHLFDTETAKCKQSNHAAIKSCCIALYKTGTDCSSLLWAFSMPHAHEGYNSSSVINAILRGRVLIPDLPPPRPVSILPCLHQLHSASLQHLSTCHNWESHSQSDLNSWSSPAHKFSEYRSLSNYGWKFDVSVVGWETK